MLEDKCKLFAKNIKKYRESKGYSKTKLAELADCDLTYIGKIEKSEKYPNLKMIFKLAEALDIPTKDLFDFGN
jgi:transcriptional regulator with XRE-family HTH domain